jgi:hypothetical protein
MCRISLRVTSGPSNSLRKGRSSRRKGMERKFSSQRSWMLSDMVFVVDDSSDFDRVVLIEGCGKRLY